MKHLLMLTAVAAGTLLFTAGTASAQCYRGGGIGYGHGHHGHTAFGYRSFGGPSYGYRSFGYRSYGHGRFDRGGWGPGYGSFYGPGPYRGRSGFGLIIR